MTPPPPPQQPPFRSTREAVEAEERAQETLRAAVHAYAALAVRPLPPDDSPERSNCAAVRAHASLRARILIALADAEVPWR